MHFVRWTLCTRSKRSRVSAVLAALVWNIANCQAKLDMFWLNIANCTAVQIRQSLICLGANCKFCSWSVASFAADLWPVLLPSCKSLFSTHSSVYVLLPFVIIKARKFTDNKNSWFVEFKCRLLFNFFYESFRLRNDVMGSLDHSWTKRFGPFGQLLAIFTTFWIFLTHFLKKQTWEQRSLD